jgi:hypothetical protein
MNQPKYFLSIITLLLINTIITAVAAAQSSGGDGNNGSAVSLSFTPNTMMTIEAPVLVGGIELDGVLEPAWQNAVKADNFCEVSPSENIKPLVQTEVYFMNDAVNLYVAFVCFDPNIKELRASMTERDNCFQDDFVGIIFDPYADHQAGYEYFINPYGIQADLLREINGNENTSYDAVWFSEGKVYDDRWIVEARIPFKSLRFPNRAEQNWLIHILRIYPRQSRYQYSWMPFSRNNSSFFGQAGHLKMNLHGASHSKIEFLPYVLGTQNFEMADRNGSGEWKSPKWDANAGFNFKYGISSTVTLDFAYNPDFSQIEADAGQISVNNTYALYNTEKRPFFLEGNDIFKLTRFNNYIYTRTTNDPLVAGKVTGKIGNMTFGLISAYDENTPFIMPYEFQSVEQTTNWNSFNNILRMKYSLGDQRFIGLTATNRSLNGGAGNSTIALDANWRLNKNYVWSATAGFTHTKEINDSAFSHDNMDSLSFKSMSRRYDSYFNGEKFDGWMLSSSFERDARHWSFFAYYDELSPGFRNDQGYMVSNNFRRVGLWSGYTFYTDHSPVFNRIIPQFDIVRKYNFDGRLNDFWINPAISFQMKKQTSIYIAAMIVNNEYFKTKQFNRMHRIWINVQSEAFKKFTGGFFIMAGKYLNRDGEENEPRNPFDVVKGLQYEIWTTVKPNPSFANEIDFVSYNLWTHYGGSKIVGQNIIRNTLTYQISRRLSLRLIGQMIYTNYFDSDEQDMISSKDFSVDPLVSYKINPFTVFYIGAHIGGTKNPYPNREGMQMTNQTIFTKFQYLMQI